MSKNKKIIYGVLIALIILFITLGILGSSSGIVSCIASCKCLGIPLGSNICFGYKSCQCCTNTDCGLIKEEATITTDKTEYKQDEVCKISIKNDGENEIEICGESACSMLGSFPTSIEKLENQAWTQEIIACPVNNTIIAKVKNKIVNDSNYNCMVISKNNPIELEILLPQKIGTYRIVYFYSSDKKPLYSNEFTIVGSNTQITEITLTGARGDFVDPGPIEAECQKHLENYINGIDFINKKSSQCQLIESKVGVGDEQCPNGWSPQGCYICKLKCQ